MRGICWAAGGRGGGERGRGGTLRILRLCGARHPLHRLGGSRVLAKFPQPFAHRAHRAPHAGRTASLPALAGTAVPPYRRCRVRAGTAPGESTARTVPRAHVRSAPARVVGRPRVGGRRRTRLGRRGAGQPGALAGDGGTGSRRWASTPSRQAGGGPPAWAPCTWRASHLGAARLGSSSHASALGRPAGPADRPAGQPGGSTGVIPQRETTPAGPLPRTTGLSGE